MILPIYIEFSKVKLFEFNIFQRTILIELKYVCGPREREFLYEIHIYYFGQQPKADLDVGLI